MTEDLFKRIHRIGEEKDRTSQQDSPRDRSLAIKRRIAEIHAARGPAILEAEQEVRKNKALLDGTAKDLKTLGVPLTEDEELWRLHNLKHKKGTHARELAKEERALHHEHKGLGISEKESPKKFRSASWDSIARKREMVVEDASGRADFEGNITDLEKQIEAAKTFFDVVVTKKHQMVFESIISDVDVDPFIVNQREIGVKLFGGIKEELSYAEKNLELTKNPKYEGIVFKTPYILKKNGDKLDRTEDQLKDDGIVFEKMVQEKRIELETRKAQAAEAIEARLLDKASELFTENQVLKNSLKVQIPDAEFLNRNADLRGAVRSKNKELAIRRIQISTESEALVVKIDKLENDFSAKIKEESRKIVEQW